MVRVLKDSFKNTLPTDRKTKEKFFKKANTKCTAEKSAVHFVCNKNIQGRKFAHMDLFKHIDKKQFSGVLIVFFHT